MPICDKCDARIPDGAKFCPQCADPVTEADFRTEPPQEQDIPQITVEFGYSSSSRFGDAAELAAKLPTHEQEGEGTSVKHRVALEATDVALAASLWDIVGNWKTSRMEIDGERVTKKDLTYGALGCYQTRQDAFQPEEYCYGEDEYRQNVWGCHQLELGLNAWKDSWLTWGEFDDEGAWYWDKARIRHELEKGLYEFRFCPVLDRAEALATLDRLPDGINPETDPNWNYVTDWGDRKEVAVGICPTLDEAKRLSAGKHRPGWKSNAGLDGASSELTDYEAEDRKLEQELQIRASPKPTQKESGCMIAVLTLATVPVLLAFFI